MTQGNSPSDGWTVRPTWCKPFEFRRVLRRYILRAKSLPIPCERVCVVQRYSFSFFFCRPYFQLLTTQLYLELHLHSGLQVWGVVNPDSDGFHYLERVSKMAQSRKAVVRRGQSRAVPQDDVIFETRSNNLLVVLAALAPSDRKVMESSNNER